MARDTPLGFPAHTLHPQGVCSIRKAAEPLTAALPYRCGEFTTLSTASPVPFRLALNGSFRDRKSTRLNSSHIEESRMPSSA